MIKPTDQVHLMAI